MPLEPAPKSGERRNGNKVIDLKTLAHDISIVPPKTVPAALMNPASPDTAVVSAANDANQRIEEAITLLRGFQGKLNADANELADNLRPTTAGRIADLFRAFVQEEVGPVSTRG